MLSRSRRLDLFLFGELKGDLQILGPTNKPQIDP